MTGLVMRDCIPPARLMLYDKSTMPAKEQKTYTCGCVLQGTRRRSTCSSGCGMIAARNVCTTYVSCSAAYL